MLFFWDSKDSELGALLGTIGFTFHSNSFLSLPGEGEPLRDLGQVARL